VETFSSRLFRQPNHGTDSSRTWALFFRGTLLIIFGAASILLPTKILFFRVFELALGRPQSSTGNMTAFACVLGIVVIVLIDTLLHLFSSFELQGMSHALPLGSFGIVAIVPALFWPDVTAYVAILLIAGCAVLIGTLELVDMVGHRNVSKPWFLIASTGLMLITVGAFTMVRFFAGTVILLVGIGIAAIVRGVLLIVRGFDVRAIKSPTVVDSTHSRRRAA